MRILVLNGSPRKNGTMATLFNCVREGIPRGWEVEWIDVCLFPIRAGGDGTAIFCIKKEPAVFSYGLDDDGGGQIPWLSGQLLRALRTESDEAGF